MPQILQKTAAGREMIGNNWTNLQNLDHLIWYICPENSVNAVNFQGSFMALEESEIKLSSCIFDMGWGHGIPDFTSSYHVIMLPAQFNIKELSYKIHVRSMCPCTWTHKCSSPGHLTKNTATWMFSLRSERKPKVWPKCTDSSEYSGYLKAVFGALHSPVWRITMFDLRRQAGTLPQAVINN